MKVARGSQLQMEAHQKLSFTMQSWSPCKTRLSKGIDLQKRNNDFAAKQVGRQTSGEFRRQTNDDMNGSRDQDMGLLQAAETHSSA
jgi:hypothetical protein